MKNIRIILTLLIVFVVVVSTMLWNFYRLQSDLINSSAMRTAEIYSVALTQFRILYTSEVVVRAEKMGVTAAHDYDSQENQIPLPATLSMKLGEEIGKHANGAKAQLYSPFPWRVKKSTTQSTSFKNDAWNFLSSHPNETYSRFEKLGTNTVLHYATADIMRPECVACHNSHPDSPKKDWKIGDVRGVLSISLPLNDIVLQTEANLKNTSFAYFAIGLGLVLVIGFVIIKLRQQAQELQYRVADRTAKLEAEISERRQAMETLAEEEQKNRLLLDSAGEGIYGLDLSGKSTFVNPAACKMLGYDADEFRNQTMHDLVHHSHPDGSAYSSEECPMNAAFTDGQIHRVVDEVLWRKDKTNFPVEYTSTPIRKDGILVGAVVIFNDISERKKVERMKAEFISTVSHELRTPLTSIKGSLSLIVGGALGDLPPKIMDMLTVAHENSDRLALLINDLLDLSKIESIGTTFQMFPININSLISKAILSNQGYADKYGVQFLWQPSEDDKVYISGDENRLIQVLSNLLSNAIKYSPKGDQIVVSTNHNNKQVRVSITDTGSGIPLEFQDRIFEKFTQADSSDTRNVGGTGLGLAISKEIIEKHGGHIGFKSTHGQGTTFYFNLPIIEFSEPDTK
jgi:PAS domain S-box-containing protein